MSRRSTDTELSVDEYHFRAHFLDPEFKRSLARYRHKWLVPRELDEALNPVLREFPDTFSRVLSPFELDELEGMKPGRLAADMVESWRRGGRSKARVLQDAAMKAKLGRKAAARLQAVLDGFIGGLKQVDPIWWAWLRQKWPKYPGGIPWVCAEYDDVGECSMKGERWRSVLNEEVPYAVTPHPRTIREDIHGNPFSMLDGKLDRNPRPGETFDERWVKAWLMAGMTIVLVRPGMTKTDRWDAWIAAGVVGRRGEKHALKPKGDELVKLMAFRWYVVGHTKRKDSGLRVFAEGKDAWIAAICHGAAEWCKRKNVRGSVTEADISNWCGGSGSDRVRLAKKLGIEIKVRRKTKRER